MMLIDALFLDLDDTIYPPGNGIWEAISHRINLFMIERLSFTPQQAEVKREEYLRRYGTSLTGLMRHHGVDPADYLNFVHDIQLDSYLSPDTELLHNLSKLDMPKHIFTNASRAHAKRVLGRLGVRDTISTIVAIEDLNYVNKPDPQAFASALLAADSPNPKSSLLADDRVENLRAAAAQGWRTAWVSPSITSNEVDIYAPDINALLISLKDLTGEGAGHG
jgi:putative hydrolase of the HAD superfamily